MSGIVAPALVVPKSQGEATRRALLDAGLLRLDLKVARDGDTLFLPLKEDAEFGGFSVVRRSFETAETHGPSWQESAAPALPPVLASLLPSSFDQIGDVIVLKLPEELEPHRALIGSALLRSVKSAASVAIDRGVEGEHRVRALEVIAGRESTMTEHVEHGVRLKVNPATAYFSPRLATERKRVADLVAPGERVVDLMAGVGPFALVIAKLAKPARVDAVDVNAAAVAALVENVRANRAEGVVHAVLADARDYASAHPGVADRVVTNLPHSAHAFLASALGVLKPRGTWHYHCITSEAKLPGHVAQLTDEAEALGRRIAVTATRVVRTYSPSERHYAVDFSVDPA